MEAKENVIDNVKCFVKLNYKGGGDFINNHVSNCNNQLDAETSSFYFLSGNGNFVKIPFLQIVKKQKYLPCL